MALGAIWALTGIEGAALAAFLGAVGFVIAQVVEGRIDLSDYIGGQRDRR